MGLFDHELDSVSDSAHTGGDEEEEGLPVPGAPEMHWFRWSVCESEGAVTSRGLFEV